MTEYRQAGHCCILSNGFEEVFSTDMDEWYEVCNQYMCPFFQTFLQFNILIWLWTIVFILWQQLEKKFCSE